MHLTHVPHAETVLRQALSTHPDLGIGDVDFAIGVIMGLIAEGYDLALSPAVLYLFRCSNAGRLALTYNRDFDHAVRNRDSAALRSLLQGGKELMVEVYDNPLLTEDQFLHYTDLVARDHATFLHSLSDPLHEEGCFSPTRSIEISMYRTGGSQVEATLMHRDRWPDYVYTVDCKGTVPCLYHLEFLSLLEALLQERPTNPVSRRPFAAWVVTMLRSRFGKELAIYQRYREER